MVWAARLAAVVAGSNWVFVGAGSGVPRRAPVKSLNVSRRHRLMLGKVTGPLPDRPPAAATASTSRRQEVWSDTGEKIRPPTRARGRTPAPGTQRRRADRRRECRLGRPG